MKTRIIAADPESKLTLNGLMPESGAPGLAAMRGKFLGILRDHPEIMHLAVRLHGVEQRENGAHGTTTGWIEIRGPDMVALAEAGDVDDVLDRLIEKLNRRIARAGVPRKDGRASRATGAPGATASKTR